VVRSLSTGQLTFLYGLAASLLVVVIASLFRSCHLAIAAPLLFILLIGLFFFHRRWLLCRLQSRPDPTGLPPLSAPPPGDALEAWVHRYATSAPRENEGAGDNFDALFDNLQDGILLLDGHNRILRANTTAANLLGERSETLVGRSLSEIADHAGLEPLIGEIRATGTYQAVEIPLQSAATLCNAAGIPLGERDRHADDHVMLVLRDLTRLRQLERAGEEYALNVSHELKTPLTLILGYAETLLSQGEIDPGFRESSLRTIQRHAKRILRIVDDLLRLAWLKNENYTVGIPRATVPIATVIEEAVSVCREWARSAGIEIDTHMPAGLVWNLNSGLMEEAIINLVKNAILYALVGPIEIRVRVLDNSSRLEIAVIDRGPGLKPEDAERIFDRFYRADKSRSRASGGSGLGLPIVQQIVEAHHGTARVETAPGAGCTFILEIPSN
jgi:two-component system, OmpR family, phosphate regulon sensor histidine kinase PhoR